MPHETCPLELNLAPKVSLALEYTGMSPGNPDGIATCASSCPLGLASGVGSAAPRGDGESDAVVPPPPHEITSTIAVATRADLIAAPSPGGPSFRAGWRRA